MVRQKYSPEEVRSFVFALLGGTIAAVGYSLKQQFGETETQRELMSYLSSIREEEAGALQ